MFVRLSTSVSYSQGMLETARTLYPLNCAYDALCPRKVTRILSVCTLGFLPLIVPPDTILLRRHAINVSVRRYVSLGYNKFVWVLDLL